MVWFTVVSVHCLVCLLCPQWGVLVCSSVQHKVTTTLLRRSLDASDFPRWTWIYFKKNGKHGILEGKKENKKDISLCECSFLESIQNLSISAAWSFKCCSSTSVISLQDLLQGTKHSECLGCCLACFLFIISPSFSRFYT